MIRSADDCSREGEKADILSLGYTDNPFRKPGLTKIVV
jgi:hypothetical protein